MKKYLLILPILLLTSCSVKVNPPNDPLQDLQNVANALNDISFATNSAVKGLLIVRPDNTPERQQILRIITKLVEANNRGINVVRSITTLNPADSQYLYSILTSVFAEFHAAIDSGLLGIKNPQEQEKYGAYIDAISVSISIIESILKARTANVTRDDNSFDYFGRSIRPTTYSFAWT